jgi:glycosyltransferase involved in cell wall biosynthesis
LKLPKGLYWQATEAEELLFIKSVVGDEAHVFVAANFPNLLPPVEGPTKKSGALIMGTIALISPMKNHLEVLRVLMKIQETVIWHIYGPVKDKDYWQDCLELMKRLPEHIKVIYHGEIEPQRITDAFQCFQVMIMPSKSENFGHALAEALSAGKPIITTNTTPFSDVEASGCGQVLAIENLQEEMVAAIKFMAQMPAAEYEKASLQAVNYSHQRFQKNDLVAKYLQLFGNSFAGHENKT